MARRGFGTDDLKGAIGRAAAVGTFSTFAFETAQFLQDAKVALAVANVVVQNVAGVLAVFGGAALGNRLFAVS